LALSNPWPAYDLPTLAAVYDGLGRRVQTSYQPTVSGSASGAASTLTYYYDPQVEFLELGQLNGTDRTWKVYGPDKSGTYGGAQGIGGLDNEVDEAGNFDNVPINNYFGDAVGETFYESLGTGVYSYESYPYVSALGGYGYEPGSNYYDLTPQWRGHYVDWTGLIYMGARYYEPQSGRFLSADPLGNASSMSLYDYCNGDPVNGLDPDGEDPSLWGSGVSCVQCHSPQSLLSTPLPPPTLQPPLIVCHGAGGGGYYSGNPSQFSNLQTLPSSGPNAQQGYQIIENTTTNASILVGGTVVTMGGADAVTALYEAGTFGTGASGATYYTLANGAFGAVNGGTLNIATQLANTGQVNTGQFGVSVVGGTIFGLGSGGA